MLAKPRPHFKANHCQNMKKAFRKTEGGPDNFVVRVTKSQEALGTLSPFPNVPHPQQIKAHSKRIGMG